MILDMYVQRSLHVNSKKDKQKQINSEVHMTGSKKDSIFSNVIIIYAELVFQIYLELSNG